MKPELLRRAGEFPMVGLRDEHMEVRVVASLGAKIVALLDRIRGREWTWAARPDRGLHRNAVGDAFDNSPLVGIDECIPTVAPCSLDGMSLPDHGEAWPRAWNFDEAALEQGRIVTSIRLATRPLTFSRTLTLAGGRLRLAYELRNDSDAACSYAWALHPLLAMRPGDRIALDGVPRGRVDSAVGIDGIGAGDEIDWPRPAGGVQLDELDFGRTPAAIKLYVPTPPAAGFRVVNANDGTRLAARYGPAEALPFLGVWISRGGWNAYDHFALEPTNVDDDRLDRSLGSAATTLAPGETRRWQVEVGFEEFDA